MKCFVNRTTELRQTIDAAWLTMAPVREEWKDVVGDGGAGEGVDVFTRNDPLARKRRRDRKDPAFL